MTEHDLLEVVEIEETCGLSRWGWESYHAELTSGNSVLMFVAGINEWSAGPFHSNLIGGFLAARILADQMHINNVAVRPAYRRLGLASSLLETALREGERCGAIEALLEVRISNLAAQSLYRKLGFRPSGQRRDYYALPTEDALVMSHLM
jgi:ribosomal-protein-alanine N-acetyltransferase